MKQALWLRLSGGIKPNGHANKPKRSVRARRLKTRSAGYESRMRVYRERVKLFLKRHPWCEVYPLLPSTQNHHERGRLKSLLLDERFWHAVSMAGHEWIGAHPDEARKRGLLCEKGKWNVYE